MLDCYIGSGTTMATAHKLNRNYIGFEIGDQMTDLVVRRMNLVVNGENGGISSEVNWLGGGEFALYNFDKNKVEEHKIADEPVSHRQPVQYINSTFSTFSNNMVKSLWLRTVWFVRTLKLNTARSILILNCRLT